jgi:hypothetical protein
VERCAWVAAGELEPGERVGSQATAWSDAAAGEVAGGSAAGGAAEVLAVLPVAGRVVVYNLEVRGGQTYFVSEAAVWVHNCFIPNPKWGRNRFVKELHDAGFKLDRSSRSGGGLIYRHPNGAEYRVMPRPNRRHRNDPAAKFQSDHYYRYKPPNGNWGPHTPLPAK